MEHIEIDFPSLPSMNWLELDNITYYEALIVAVPINTYDLMMILVNKKYSEVTP